MGKYLMLRQALLKAQILQHNISFIARLNVDLNMSTEHHATALKITILCTDKWLQTNIRLIVTKTFDLPQRLHMSRPGETKFQRSLSLPFTLFEGILISGTILQIRKRHRSACLPGHLRCLNGRKLSFGQ